jgi:hypothetical protein
MEEIASKQCSRTNTEHHPGNTWHSLRLVGYARISKDIHLVGYSKNVQINQQGCYATTLHCRLAT